MQTRCFSHPLYFSGLLVFPRRLPSASNVSVARCRPISCVRSRQSSQLMLSFFLSPCCSIHFTPPVLSYCPTLRRQAAEGRHKGSGCREGEEVKLSLWSIGKHGRDLSQTSWGRPWSLYPEEGKRWKSHLYNLLAGFYGPVGRVSQSNVKLLLIYFKPLTIIASISILCNRENWKQKEAAGS